MHPISCVPVKATMFFSFSLHSRRFSIHTLSHFSPRNNFTRNSTYQSIARGFSRYSIWQATAERSIYGLVANSDTIMVLHRGGTTYIVHVMVYSFAGAIASSEREPCSTLLCSICSAIFDIEEYYVWTMRRVTQVNYLPFRSRWLSSPSPRLHVPIITRRQVGYSIVFHSNHFL